MGSSTVEKSPGEEERKHRHRHHHHHHHRHRSKERGEGERSQGHRHHHHHHHHHHSKDGEESGHRHRHHHKHHHHRSRSLDKAEASARSSGRGMPHGSGRHASPPARVPSVAASPKPQPSPTKPARPAIGAARGLAVDPKFHKAWISKQIGVPQVQSPQKKKSPNSPGALPMGRGGASSSLAEKKEPKPKPPPKTGVFAAKPPVETLFRKVYERGDLPLCVEHAASRRLKWKVDPSKLDIHTYLPLFVDGLREKQEPYKFIALTGAQDLMTSAGEKKLVDCLPLLIQPLREALISKDHEVLCTTMKFLQALVSGYKIGEALIPYYRQILPTFNLFITRRVNLGDGIEWSQHKRQNIADLILETLEQFEQWGGEDAFINIKYLIPSYQTTQG